LAALGEQQSLFDGGDNYATTPKLPVWLAICGRGRYNKVHKQYQSEVKSAGMASERF
jgi:ubiquitin